MRTPPIDLALAETISHERLEKYLAENAGDLSLAIALYERNCRLSESFYSPLQSMEVCLRNRLSTEMAKTFGLDWLQNGTPPFERDAVDSIAKVIDSLGRHPVTGGRIIAELNFGFWVGLLGPRYDATLWRLSLHRAFRAAGSKKRSIVHGRFNALRRFRNRIAHHEPIFHRPLAQLHDETIEAIGWMCAETSAWTLHLSNFVAVYTAP